MTSLSASRPIPRIALNKNELAMAIGFSLHEIDDMIVDGVLPKPRRRGRRRYWLITEIEAALTDQPYEGEASRPGEASDDDDWEVT